MYRYLATRMLCSQSGFGDVSQGVAFGVGGLGCVGACIICSGTGTVVYDVGGDVIAYRLYIYIGM